LAGTLTRAVTGFFGLRGRGTGTAFVEAVKMNTQRLTPEQLARFEKWKKENHPLLEAIKRNQ